MNCERADLLVGLLGAPGSLGSDDDPDALTPAERREAEAHVAGCAACREALEAYRALSGALRGLPPVVDEAPSPEAAARAYAAVVEAMAASGGAGRQAGLRVLAGDRALGRGGATQGGRARRRPGLWLQGLAAAACVLIVVSLALRSDEPRASVSRAPQAPAEAPSAGQAAPAEQRRVAPSAPARDERGGPAADGAHEPGAQGADAAERRAFGRADEARRAAGARAGEARAGEARAGEARAGEARAGDLADALADDEAAAALPEAPREAPPAAPPEADADAAATPRGAPRPAAPLASPPPAAGPSQGGGRGGPALAQVEADGVAANGAVPLSGVADDPDAAMSGGANAPEAEREPAAVVAAWRIGERVVVVERAGEVVVAREGALRAGDFARGRARAQPPSPADGQAQRSAPGEPSPPEPSVPERSAEAFDAAADAAPRVTPLPIDDVTAAPATDLGVEARRGLERDLRAILAAELRAARDAAWRDRVAAALLALGERVPASSGADELAARARRVLSAAEAQAAPSAR